MPPPIADAPSAAALEPSSDAAAAEATSNDEMPEVLGWDDFEYGFDTQMGYAYRLKLGGTERKHPERGITVEPSSGASNTDPVYADFKKPDYKYEIPFMTVGDVRRKKQGKPLAIIAKAVKAKTAKRSGADADNLHIGQAADGTIVSWVHKQDKREGRCDSIGLKLESSALSQKRNNYYICSFFY